MTTTHSRLGGLVGALVLVPLLAATAAPAQAAPSEGDSYATSKRYSTSYFGLSNVCAEVYTHIVADDRGSFLRISSGSNASFRIYNCATGATRTDVTGRLTWTVTAKGWALDGCGGSIPLGFSCSGSTTSVSVTEEWSARGSYRRVVGSGETYTFRDSVPGDIDSVRSRVNVVVNGVGLSAATEVQAP